MPCPISKGKDARAPYRALVWQDTYNTFVTIFLSNVIIRCLIQQTHCEGIPGGDFEVSTDGVDEWCLVEEVGHNGKVQREADNEGKCYEEKSSKEH